MHKAAVDPSNYDGGTHSQRLFTPMPGPSQRELGRRFQSLHDTESDILVLPNAWDAASALIFEDAGHAAIGTSSSGIAASHGLPSGRLLSREQMLDVVERIASAVDIPVSADMEGGYGDNPETIGETTKKTIEAGAVGINLEDGGGYGSDEIAPLDRQTQRIRSARAVADQTDIPFVINARTDVFWLEQGEPDERVSLALERANAYAEAGADCLFIPGVSETETLATLVDGLNGPLNALGGPGGPTVSELADLGVGRVSVGSGPMRTTLGHLREVAGELAADGTYDRMDAAIPYGEWNAFLSDSGLVDE